MYVGIRTPAYWMRTLRWLGAVALVAMAACATGGVGAGPPSSPSTTPCQDVDPDCHAERLPDLVLQGDQTSGALESVDGFDLDGIIDSDQALRRAWEEDGQGDADTVQVILGSADATKLHWDRAGASSTPSSGEACAPRSLVGPS
jgi:hypothetical protein